ncbi:MAG: hypothetical protein H8D23_37245 [Candidatus Brocadiales bacterium]|nr:hypothetical protein [Candidatus Brocadiales bacterium]
MNDKKHPNEIGVIEDGRMVWKPKPTPKSIAAMADRIEHLEDEYKHIRKSFADLVPVLDAIISSQQTQEQAIKDIVKRDKERVRIIQ